LEYRYCDWVIDPAVGPVRMLIWTLDSEHLPGEIPRLENLTGYLVLKYYYNPVILPTI
jgi:hypothetical protein